MRKRLASDTLLIYRGIMLILGVVLLLLSFLFPEIVTDKMKINGSDTEKTQEMGAGDVLIQQIGTPGPRVSSAGVTLLTNRQSKDLTATMYLLQNEAELASAELRLKGTGGKKRLEIQLDTPIALNGSEVIRLEFEGTGKTKAYGSAEGSGTTINGAASDISCEVQLGTEQRKLPYGALFIGSVLLLLGLIPLAGKQDRTATRPA